MLFPPQAWVCYVVAAGAAMIGVGLWVAPLALGLRHRAGRRRCPKCWYDLRHVPGMRCPECGREAKDERELTRARRRPRLAAAGALLVLYGAAAAIAPWWRTGAWAERLPTWALLRMYPVLDPPRATRGGYNSQQRPVLTSLMGRLWDQEVSEGQRASLSAWCVGTIERSGDPLARREAADLLFRITPPNAEWFARVRTAFERETDGKAREGLQRATARLGGRLPEGCEWIKAQVAGAADESTILYALMGVPETGPEASWYVPMLTGLASNPTNTAAGTAILTLARMGPIASDSIPTLEAAMLAAPASPAGPMVYECALACVRGEVSRPAEWWATQLTSPNPTRRMVGAYQIGDAIDGSDVEVRITAALVEAFINEPPTELFRGGTPFDGMWQSINKRRELLGPHRAALREFAGSPGLDAEQRRGVLFLLEDVP